jgi:stearoyl-CoA desaturase (Delta-9 desaturase)
MKSSKYDWGVLFFIVGYHLALLIGLPIYLINHSPTWGICVVAGLLMYISGISVTAGYHRLYSHSTYKINRWMEAVLLFFATMATQGSALKWACDHRKHHAYVDTEQDPYSIKKGFLFAHVLWMFQKADPVDMRVVADLAKNRLLMFQHRYYAPLMFATNIFAFLLMGYLFNDYLSSFVFIWGVRLFVLHHFTWFINSLAHTWGSKSFSQEHSAVDNYFMSIFTFGEGYHNYHHTFANDYRNGIRWYHFDPTKWLIWVLAKCKLAYGLRKVSHIRIQERMVIERKNELIEMVKNYLSVNSALLEEKIEKTTKEILGKFSDFYRLTQEYNTYKKEGSSNPDLLKDLHLQIKSLKKTLAQDWAAWNKLSKDIMRQATS